MSHSWIFSLLLVFLVLGGVFRLFDISSQSYWMDEGYTVNAVLSVVEIGSTILDSGENYSCPTYCYPTAYLIKTFGDAPINYRLLSVLAGLLFILAIFFITKKLFNKNIALLSAFFLTFSYWQIAWSRQARWYTLFSLLFWLALYFFYQLIYSKKNKKINVFLTLIFTTLAILTHGLGYLLPIIFVGWALIDQYFIQRKNNWQKSLFIVLGGVLILWLINQLMNINILSYFYNTFKLHYVLPYYLSFYLRNYWLFIILSLIAVFNKKNPYKKEMQFLLFTLGIYFIPLSFFNDIVHYRYLFHLTPILFIFGSIGLLNLNKEIKSQTGKIVLWLITLGLFATIAGGVFWPKTNYYLESDNPDVLDNRPYYAYTPQPNWNKAYAFIKENKKEDELIISSQPQFNKIFLNEAGYWIKYNYLGFENKPKLIKNDKEYYVGATVIDDLEEFKSLTSNSHGFIVFDFMSINNRIPENIQNYIKTSFNLVFYENTNSYSEIWVYGF